MTGRDVRKPLLHRGPKSSSDKKDESKSPIGNDEKPVDGAQSDSGGSGKDERSESIGS